MHQDETLRERKKRLARAAMSEAALRGALADGVKAVSAESVAATVGVSPRTFRNYFGSVEEAIADGIAQRGMALVDEVSGRPAGEPVWDSLLSLLPEHIDDFLGDRTDTARVFELFEQSPAVLAHHLAAFEHVEHALAGALAARLGVDPATDPTPALLGGAAMVAVRVAIVASLQRPDRSPPDLVRDCLTRLRAGLP